MSAPQLLGQDDDMAPAHLHKARAVKNDEFYTQPQDVARGMAQFTDRDPDVFRGKTVLLPCDDPEWSAFTAHFLDNFHTYGLARLISTSYARPTEIMGEQPRGRVLDTTTGGRSWTYLGGDGDFRNAEVTAYRDQADIVITNPPFSQVTDFMGWATTGNAELALVAPVTALGYKSVFPHIKSGRVWVGDGAYEAPASFILPMGGGTKDISSVWLASILASPRGKTPIPLRTMAENRALADGKRFAWSLYHDYDNIPAMEVPRVDLIPSDYDGLVGVPLSFLMRHDPEQFDIVAVTQPSDAWFARNSKFYGQVPCLRDGLFVRSNNLLDCDGVLRADPQPGRMYALVDGETYLRTFTRVIIRRR